MNEKNDFALVTRPSSALQKAEPGAKRILYGMVADTLALVKKEQANKPVVSVVMCGCADAGFQEMIELMLQRDLATQSSTELKSFSWPTDLISAARKSRFDLFILLLNPGIYSRKDNAEHPLRQEPNWADHGDEINAYELIASLKLEFDKPVFVISNATTYSSRAELDRAGADAVFWMPFGSDEFRSALQTCGIFPISIDSTAPFDEAIYLEAKPHFDKVWESTKRSGGSLKDFLMAMFKRWGDGIKPYLRRWREDLMAEAKGAVNEQPMDQRGGRLEAGDAETPGGEGGTAGSTRCGRVGSDQSKTGEGVGDRRKSSIAGSGGPIGESGDASTSAA